MELLDRELSEGAGGPRARPKLLLDGLVKRYGATTAVRELSLEVFEGEFLTLLGPSGSGKSTTLMMVAGLIPHDAGRILLDGHDISRLPAFKRNIGVVFQSYALFPHLTAFDNVAFPLRIRRLPKAEIARRVAHVLEVVRLPDVAARYPRQLSGGQQQRIALARALAFNPSLLLMDEPLGALDRQLRNEVRTEIKRIHRDLNVTIVHVTHDQEEAMALSDRIAVMHTGALEQVGAPRDLYEEPASEFVAQFIGDTNLLDAVVAGASAGAATVRVGGTLRLEVRVPRAVAEGDRVRLAVRPERARFAGSGERVDHECRGRIVDVEYGGESVRYSVALDESVVFIVRTPSAGRADPPHKKGDTVTVGWGHDDMRVFC